MRKPENTNYRPVWKHSNELNPPDGVPLRSQGDSAHSVYMPVDHFLLKETSFRAFFTQPELKIV
ncbi:MAG: hypothetical protein QM579_04215 [Desulfovibrio sp.]|uniref:hypothetical protein n=1 Tax=Desulfovibrio sp. TaxID=885 RepID=UPI0039E2F51A